jgi:hypothetical protein
MQPTVSKVLLRVQRKRSARPFLILGKVVLEPELPSSPLEAPSHARMKPVRRLDDVPRT